MSQDGSATAGGPSVGASIETVLSQLDGMVRELRGQSIDPDQNYFSAGLDSATVVKLHTILTRRLDIWVPVMGLFRGPTLRRTAAMVVEARDAWARDAAARAAAPDAPADRHSGDQSPVRQRRGAGSRREIRAQIRRDGASG